MNQYISALAAFSFPFTELSVIFLSCQAVNRAILQSVSWSFIVSIKNVLSALGQLVSEPGCQTASQSVFQSASLAVSHTASLPGCLTAIQSDWQSARLPVCRTAIQPVWKSTSVPVCRIAIQANNESIEKEQNGSSISQPKFSSHSPYC